VIIVILLITAVTALAMAAFWPRHRQWLRPLLAVPWVGALVAPAINPLYSSVVVIPMALAVLLPLLAFFIDRWKSLRASLGFWIALAVGSALLGYVVWAGAAGELGLNHDSQYCLEGTRSLSDCPLDPLLVVNVYLSLAGWIVIWGGSIPSIILFAWLGYRRRPPVIVQSGS
jgi:hypothetical protein